MTRVLPHDAGARSALVAQLAAYRAADALEEAHRARIHNHVEGERDWWHRDTLPGHVTASAFIADATLDHLVLHHHRKLDRWLQLGGHVEDEQRPDRSALREVFEESGLSEVGFFGGEPSIFDLDVHPIPARGKMPGHDHLDVRFLLIADRAAPLALAEEESNALEWVPLFEAVERMNEEGARRVGRKLADLREALQAAR